MSINTPPTLFTGNNLADTAQSVFIQPDGKIVVGGYRANGSKYDFVLVRYNSDGSLDTTLGDNGIVITAVGTSYDSADSVIVQDDGKILLSGSSRNASNDNDFAIVRYNSDGTLDITFDGDGMVTTNFFSYDSINSIVVQSDGKILAAGTTNNTNDIALARYNSDGSLDTTFGTNGKVSTDLGTNFDSGKDITLQADGKILVAGFSNEVFALVRYNSDGSLDTSFDSDGIVLTAVSDYSAAQSVTVLDNGKIIVAGFSGSGSSSDFAVVRYNSDGSLDTTFSDDGMIITPVGTSADIAYSVVIQSDGKILLGGYATNSTTDFAIVRYNIDGSLDTSFGVSGKISTDIGTDSNIGYSMSLQPDGKIVVVGTATIDGSRDFTVVRYNIDGSLDTSFDGDGIVTTAIQDLTYIENGTPVTLMGSSGTIRDTELKTIDNYNGSTLTLARHGDANIEDQFSGAGIVAGTSEGDVSVSGTVVGTYYYADGTLVISFNANATQTLVDQTVHAIAYSNTSDMPPSSIQIDWVFNDGNVSDQGTGGALSATGSTLVQIISVRDDLVLNGTSGDDILSGDLIENGSFDTISGFGGNDTIEGKDGNDILDGGDGIDTLSYATASAGVGVSIKTTTAQNTVGAGVDTVLNFENLIGSNYNDTLRGNALGNTILGLDGNDIIYAGKGTGDDILDGGNGIDAVSYYDSGAGVTVSLNITGVQNTIGNGNDTILNFERLYGSNYNDILSGNGSDNIIRGYNGDDTINGGGGNDTIDGGNGMDTVSYATAAGGVSVALSNTSAQNTGSAGIDILMSIENIIGSSYDDVLTGNTGDNTISGGVGNDTIDGGLGHDTIDGGVGDDTLDGGDGIDTLSYATASAGVGVSIKTTTAQNTVRAGVDTVLNFENLIGSNYNDTLRGNAL
ncbi:MAG: hypothetical protein PHU29_03405, partial [Sulfuricurvum sp.]|nr:hypothetical protein [Sulfuricurvum sp.]